MDRYDRAIERLNASKFFEEDVHHAWNLANTGNDPNGCLFIDARPAGDYSLQVGCLTQIKAGSATAFTEELTKAIRADPNIPADEREIRRHHLPHFGRWQRELDRLWPGRNPEENAVSVKEEEVNP